MLPAEKRGFAPDSNVHMSEAEVAHDLHAALARVQQGIEIVIERDHRPIAVLRRVWPEGNPVASLTRHIATVTAALLDVEEQPLARRRGLTSQRVVTDSIRLGAPSVLLRRPSGVISFARQHPSRPRRHREQLKRRPNVGRDLTPLEPTGNETAPYDATSLPESPILRSEQ